MNIIERVKELQFPEGQYAVFGSGPMAVKGIREANDIDIVVTSKLFRKLKEDPSWEAEQLRDRHEGLHRHGVSVYDTWAPDSWDIPQMIQEAEVIDGVPFVRLELVREWKAIRNHPKDQKDIALIDEYLKNR